MLGKNNFKLQREKNANKVNHYATRKLSVGFVSVAVSATLYFSGGSVQVVEAASEGAGIEVDGGAPTTEVVETTPPPSLETETVEEVPEPVEAVEEQVESPEEAPQAQEETASPAEEEPVEAEVNEEAEAAPAEEAAEEQAPAPEVEEALRQARPVPPSAQVEEDAKDPAEAEQEPQNQPQPVETLKVSFDELVNQSYDPRSAIANFDQLPEGTTARFTRTITMDGNYDVELVYPDERKELIQVYVDVDSAMPRPVSRQVPEELIGTSGFYAALPDGTQTGTNEATYVRIGPTGDPINPDERELDTVITASNWRLSPLTIDNPQRNSSLPTHTNLSATIHIPNDAQPGQTFSIVLDKKLRFTGINQAQIRNELDIRDQEGNLVARGTMPNTGKYEFTLTDAVANLGPITANINYSVNTNPETFNFTGSQIIDNTRLIDESGQESVMPVVTLTNQMSSYKTGNNPLTGGLREFDTDKGTYRLVYYLKDYNKDIFNRDEDWYNFVITEDISGNNRLSASDNALDLDTVDISRGTNDIRIYKVSDMNQLAESYYVGPNGSLVSGNATVQNITETTLNNAGNNARIQNGFAFDLMGRLTGNEGYVIEINGRLKPDKLESLKAAGSGTRTIPIAAEATSNRWRIRATGGEHNMNDTETERSRVVVSSGGVTAASRDAELRASGFFQDKHIYQSYDVNGARLSGIPEDGRELGVSTSGNNTQTYTTQERPKDGYYLHLVEDVGLFNLQLIYLNFRVMAIQLAKR